MARTNLENIIPIYRIGDGYVIAKDGSVTVGFILTLPEYDSLSKADFRDDGSGGRNAIVYATGSCDQRS